MKNRIENGMIAMNYGINNLFRFRSMKAAFFYAFCLFATATNVQAITVTFAPNGGSVSPASKTVIYGQTYGALPTPTKVGYTFQLWYNVNGDSCSSGTYVSFNYDHSLTALWEAKLYSVGYDSQGGAYNPSTRSILYGSTFDSLPTVTRTGYAFSGWWTGSGGTGVQIFPSSVFNFVTAITLYAKWTGNSYTVTFDAQSGAVSPSTKIVTYNSAYGSLPAPTRYGYTFAGWFTIAGGAGVQVTSLTTVTNTANHTLYAKWTRNSYTVTFDAQSGAVSPSTKIVTYNSAYGSLPAPTRSRYTFGGWFTSAGGAGAQVTSLTTATNAFAHTLYAKWAINIYTLDVTTPLANAIPPDGTSYFSDGTVVIASVTNSPISEGVSNHFVCIGWVGSGSVPSSGTGTNTGIFTMMNNSSVTWLWSTNYWLDESTNAQTWTVIPSKGPFAGGNTVCITNTVPSIGDGFDIINVTIGGVDAIIGNQGTNWVSIRVPLVGVSGGLDVVVRSTSLGDTTLSKAYIVNPKGVISGEYTGQYSWTKLGNAYVPINKRVRSLAYDGMGLYVGGGFTSSGSSIPVDGIAKWDPTTGWSSLSNGVNGSVKAMAYNGTNLYVGGNYFYIGRDFFGAGGIAANNTAEWSPTTGWTSLGNGLDDGVNALSYLGTNLFAGGVFLTGSSLSLGCIAKWNPATGWSSLSHDLDGNVAALANDGTNLFAGGQFIYSYNGALLNRIGKWSPTSDWSPLSTGVNGNVAALVHDGTNLYVGGAFTTAGPSAASHIAKWNPTTGWSSLGSGVNGISASVNALLFDGTNLYVGGVFTNAGGIAANNIAKWSPTTGWSSLSSGMNGSVDALAYDGTSLYAGGDFTSAGGSAISYIARWMPGSGILPSSGSFTGGYQVVISGINLGSGADITNVTICGVSASNIIDQSGTQVVVAAGSGTPGPGEVKVYSESFGVTIKSNAFIYNPAIEILFGPHGTVTPNHMTDVIYGGTTSFVVKADAYYHIESIFTNGIRVSVANNKSVYTSSWNNVTTTGLIYVAFAENLTTNTSTPECWLAQYGWTNNFEFAATNDSDSDGMLNWQEWLTGCNPKDSNSVFRFTSSESDSSGQGMVIRWPSISNRFYDLSRATNLMGETPFTVFPDASNMPARPPENVYTDSVQGVGSYFYKVGVHE